MCSVWSCSAWFLLRCISFSHKRLRGVDGRNAWMRQLPCNVLLDQVPSRRRREKKSKDPLRGDGSCLLALGLTSTFPVAQLSDRVVGTLVSTYQYNHHGNLTSSTGSVA